MLLELVSDLEVIPQSFAAVDAHGIVVRGRWTGQLEDGGLVDKVSLVVFGVAGGRICTVDWFDVADLDGALARFAELRPDYSAIVPNTASRVADVVTSALVAGDTDASRALCSEGIVFDTRVQLGEAVGGREAIEHIRQLASREGFEASVVSTLIATAGDRLALHYRVWGGTWDGGPWHNENFDLFEIGEDGLVTAVVTFDVSERRAAFTELYRRFYTPGHSKRPFGGEVTDAIRSGDAARYLEWIKDGARIIDHRLISVSMPAAEHASVMDTHDELTTETDLEVTQVLRETSRAALTTNRWVGVLREGGSYEQEFVSITLTDERGLLAHIELFDVDDLPAGARSVRRAHACRPRRSVSPFSHRTDDSYPSLRRADRRDHEWRLGHIPLGLCSRHGLRYPRAVRRWRCRARGGCRRASRCWPREKGLWPTSSRLSSPRPATASRCIFESGPASGTAALGRTRTSTSSRSIESGLITATVTFDGGDRRAAFSELYRRCHTSEHLHHPEVMAESVAGILSGDVARLKATLTPEAWVVDHRRVGIGEMPGAEYFDGLTALHEIAAKVDWEMTQVFRDSLKATVTTVRFVGVLKDGGSFESELASMSIYAEDGRVRQIELWEVEDLPEALARYDEVTGI